MLHYIAPLNLVPYGTRLDTIKKSPFYLKPLLLVLNRSQADYPSKMSSEKEGDKRPDVVSQKYLFSVL
jgi:hypothetical protein